jgi:hypothetical protein
MELDPPKIEPPFDPAWPRDATVPSAIPPLQSRTVAVHSLDRVIDTHGECGNVAARLKDLVTPITWGGPQRGLRSDLLVVRRER